MRIATPLLIPAVINPKPYWIIFRNQKELQVIVMESGIIRTLGKREKDHISLLKFKILFRIPSGDVTISTQPVLIAAKGILAITAVFGS